VIGKRRAHPRVHRGDRARPYRAGGSTLAEGQPGLGPQFGVLASEVGRPVERSPTSIDASSITQSAVLVALARRSPHVWVLFILLGTPRPVELSRRPETLAS
jgi:hypothetical protein